MRRVRNTLQASCASNNDRAAVEGETGYQACVSAGELGSKEETGDIEFAERLNPDEEHADPYDPDNPVRVCEQGPILDGHGNPVLDANGRPLMGVLLSDGRRVLDKVVYTPPIPDPEITLNPPPTPDPAATPDPTPTPATVYGQELTGGNPVGPVFNEAYFVGNNCDTVVDFVDKYDERDEDVNAQGWANSYALAEAFDMANGCGEL